MLKKILVFVAIFLINYSAFAGEIYTVKSVKISATEKNASTARNIAIETGQIKAFHILVKQYFPSSLSKINSISQDTILNSITGFELSEEKASATRYMAKLNVKFSKEQIDKLMNGLGATFQQQAKKREKQEINEISTPVPEPMASPTLMTLIVPVFEQGGKTYWFEDDNNWFSFWQRKMFLSDLRSKFTLPLGDLEDLQLLNKNIVSKNILDLSSLFQRYEVNNIALVRLGKIEKSPLEHLTLQVSYISRFSPFWQQHNFADIEGDNHEKLMKQAFEEIIKFDFSGAENMAGHKFDLTASHTIDIDLSLSSSSDWIYLENSLADSKYIQDLTLKNMNLEKCQYSLTYNISFLDLQLLLKKHNFSLQDEGNSKFTITRSFFE